MTVFVPNLLAGKTAFVAGGTSGINLDIARAFARYGARVAVLSRKQEKVDAAVAELSLLGEQAIGFAADVRNYEAVDVALDATFKKLGTIDVVLSGAAGNFIAPAAELSPNGFKAVVDIDLLGTFNVLRAAYQRLTRPGASIINISAPQATATYWGQSHVSAAKAGVDMLTKSLALEWGREGVRVNAIVPGPIIGTEGMARLAPTEEIRQQWIAANPLRRFGTGEDVANMALFLVSDAASYVNGAVLHCDGGQILGGGRDFEPPTR